MRFKAWSKDVGRMLVNCSQAFEGQVFQWVSEGQNLEILQGTGLNDVDGNEIFEGDIVKWDDCSEGRYWRVAHVRVKPSLSFKCFDCPEIANSSAHGYTFKFGNFIYTDTQNHLHIIGNRFENPELL